MKDGWGLTVADDGYLIGSDSSTTLYTLEMDKKSGDLVTKRTVEIHDGIKPVRIALEIEFEFEFLLHYKCTNILGYPIENAEMMENCP